MLVFVALCFCTKEISSRQFSGFSKTKCWCLLHFEVKKQCIMSTPQINLLLLTKGFVAFLDKKRNGSAPSAFGSGWSLPLLYIIQICIEFQGKFICS